MRGITRDCLNEMIERKLIWIYVVVTVIAVLLVLGSKSMIVQISIDDPSGTNPMSEMGRDIAVGALDSYMSFLVFLTILGTAGLLPSMMVRGRAEYFLSKPLSRTSLYLNKLFGIWLVYGGTIVLGAIVVYAFFYMGYGYFDAKLAYLFILNLVSLFIWLSLTMFAGVLTGSFAVTIMLAFLVWIVQGLLQWHEAVEQVVSSKVVTTIVDTLYYVFPKTSQLSDLTETVARGNPVESWLPLWSSLLFAVVMVGATVVIFQRKDY